MTNSTSTGSATLDADRTRARLALIRQGVAPAVADAIVAEWTPAEIAQAARRQADRHHTGPLPQK